MIDSAKRPRERNKMQNGGGAINNGLNTEGKQSGYISFVEMASSQRERIKGHLVMNDKN